MDILEKKFKGCLLWAMCGDVLGSVVEGCHPEYIQMNYPNGVTSFVNYGRGYGCYTDDSQMMLALCKTLVNNHGICDPRLCAEQYAKDFQMFRTYSSCVANILMDLQVTNDKELYKTISTRHIPEGSCDNSGVVRIAPVGLAYYDYSLLDLSVAVKDALVCTHSHPLGIDAAFIQACAIRWLCNVHNEYFDPNMFLEYLDMIAQTEEMRDKIALIKNSLGFEQKACDWKTYYESDAWERELLLSKKVASNWFQLKGTDAVAVALVAFVYHWETPLDVVSAACAYGGDTDTTACIAGALVGTLWGDEQIPTEWRGSLEDRQLAEDLASSLYKTCTLTA